MLWIAKLYLFLHRTGLKVCFRLDFVPQFLAFLANKPAKNYKKNTKKLQKKLQKLPEMKLSLLHRHHYTDTIPTKSTNHYRVHLTMEDSTYYNIVESVLHQ